MGVIGTLWGCDPRVGGELATMLIIVLLYTCFVTA